MSFNLELDIEKIKKNPNRKIKVDAEYILTQRLTIDKLKEGLFEFKKKIKILEKEPFRLAQKIQILEAKNEELKNTHFRQNITIKTTNQKFNDFKEQYKFNNVENKRNLDEKTQLLNNINNLKDRINEKSELIFQLEKNLQIKFKQIEEDRNVINKLNLKIIKIETALENSGNIKLQIDKNDNIINNLREKNETLSKSINEKIVLITKLQNINKSKEYQIEELNNKILELQNNIREFKNKMDSHKNELDKIKY